MTDQGAGNDAPTERMGRADRRFMREYIVLRALVTIGDDPPISCGLMDISVGGAKIKYDAMPPPIDTRINLSVEALKVHTTGKIVRTFQTPTGIEIAVSFDRLYQEIPGRLLEYKIRSFKSLGGRRR